jgi:uncharacterized membrane protein YcaP (DUF421 family)
VGTQTIYPQETTMDTIIGSIVIMAEITVAILEASGRISIIPHAPRHVAAPAQAA